MSHPIEPDAIYDLAGVADPHFTPDGQRLAYVRSWIDRNTMEACSHIMLMTLSDGRTEVFTQGMHDALPRFSPDGRYLAFLRRDDQPTAAGLADAGARWRGAATHPYPRRRCRIRLVAGRPAARLCGRCRS